MVDRFARWTVAFQGNGKNVVGSALIRGCNVNFFFLVAGGPGAGFGGWFLS